MSMGFKISLTAKVVILCIVPLLFQLGLLISLENFLSQSEADVDKAIKARAISDTINQLSHDIFEIESMFGSEIRLLQNTPSETEFLAELQRLRADYRKLRDLVGKDPARLRIIQKSEENAERAFTLFLSLQKSLNSGGEQSRKEREPLWLALHDCAANIMSSELVEIGKAEKAHLDKIPEVQEEFRAKIRQLVFAGTGIILLLASILTVFLTRSIVLQLRKINENASLLAMNMPLNPPLGGTDELASLDASFHNMARLLKESIKNEQAVLENARDCICSIDEVGSITRANPACSTLFNLENEELLGRRFIDLIHDEDREKANSFMLRQQSGEGSEDLEVRMNRREGATLDTLWSAQWSREQRALSCVIRDQSERIQAERIKQDVMAMVTHDLRVPLSIIQNFLKFIEEGYYGSVNERGQKFLLGTQRNCSKMLDLTNDLLDSEKIKSGMMKIEKEEIDLAEVVKQSVELLQAAAEDLNVKLVCEAQQVNLQADPKLIARTVTNLVSNAISYSPRDGVVAVRLDKLDETACVSVRDSGAGIPKDQLEKIFERFHQVSDKAAKRTGGSGLGLSICKLIVELHDGKIWVESEEGKGSTFSFSLPM